MPNRLKFYAFIIGGLGLAFVNASLIQDPPVVLVIHGGAGHIVKEAMSDSTIALYNGTLSKALNAGHKVLLAGGSSVDAVRTAIRVLEDAPLFNAGRGAVFTSQGTIELDASIMEGSKLNAGAVAGVRTIKNPIDAAAEVMEHSPHVLLMGPGAEDFASEQGLTIVAPEYFKTDRQHQMYLRMRKRDVGTDKDEGRRYVDSIADEHYKLGTVGAVALDKAGNLAAGTSTGGMIYKRHGRVGDSPIIGAGTYAENQSCAVSATGHGEYFIRGVLAYDIAALIKYRGLNVKKAARITIHEKLDTMGSTGGVIALDDKGRIAIEFNTKGMFRGYIRDRQNPVVLMFEDE